jgi:hypothetical protein
VVQFFSKKGLVKSKQVNLKWPIAVTANFDSKKRLQTVMASLLIYCYNDFGLIFIQFNNETFYLA